MKRFLISALVLSSTGIARAEQSTQDVQAAQARYERDHVGFFGLFSRAPGTPFEGADQVPLTLPEFYSAVDRPDLADRLTQNIAIKKGLTTSGSLLLTVGLLTTLVAGVVWAVDAHCSQKTCDSSDDEATTIVGASAAALGIGLLTGSAFVKCDQPTEYEQHQLAEVHNDRLPQRLGLTSITF